MLLYQLRTGIVFIDMHLRDERVLNWLRVVTAAGAMPVTFAAVAKEFECHPRTARAILHRLEAAGLVTVNKRAKRGGYLYYAAPPSRDSQAS